MHAIHFDESAITLRGGDRDLVVPHTALCTKFGLIAGASRDLADNALSGIKEVISSVDMASAEGWADRPQQDSVQVLALRSKALPRAVLWSAVIRAAADVHRMDASSPLDAVTSPELDDDWIADAVRACALAGLGVSSLNGGELSPAHSDILQWQRRKPWAELKLSSTGETVIARHMRLPATARFGRRYFSYGDPAEAQIIDLVLGDETLTVEVHDSSEFLGQHEFELVWDVDGRLGLNLLVDGSWRPLPTLTLSEMQTERNRAAAQGYRQMQEWCEVASLVQVHLLEAVEA